MNAVDGTHAAVANLRDDAIRASEGVAFFDSNTGFGSLKLVLQFTTIKTNCSYSTSILPNLSSQGLSLPLILLWSCLVYRDRALNSALKLGEDVFVLVGSNCQDSR